MKITHDQYAEHVAARFKPGSVSERLTHAAMGSAGEAGELIDAVKRTLFYGKDLDLSNVLEECGDLLFYIQAMLTECGFTLDEAMEHNIEKLRKRYPEGFSERAAIERADKEVQ